MKNGFLMKWFRKQKLIIKLLLFIPMFLLFVWELTAYMTIWFLFDYHNFLIYILFIPIGIMIRDYYIFD